MLFLLIKIEDNHSRKRRPSHYHQHDSLMNEVLSDHSELQNNLHFYMELRSNPLVITDEIVWKFNNDKMQILNELFSYINDVLRKYFKEDYFFKKLEKDPDGDIEYYDDIIMFHMKNTEIEKERDIIGDLPDNVDKMTRKDKLFDLSCKEYLYEVSMIPFFNEITKFIDRFVENLRQRGLILKCTTGDPGEYYYCFEKN